MTVDDSQMWQFWIDVGGTFTDCVAVSPNGTLRQFKALSSGVVRGRVGKQVGSRIFDPARSKDPAGFWTGSQCRLFSSTGKSVASARIANFDHAAASFELDLDENAAVAETYELSYGIPAPILAIRWILKLHPDQPCPAVQVRFGTTRGTNALLTRTGARTAFITTKGFRDVPLIGYQDRPNLFDLNIKKPDPLFRRVFEVDERICSQGKVLRPLDASAELNRCRNEGLVIESFDSVAVCLMNSYRNAVHEQQLESQLREAGFTEVSRSSEVSPQIRFVPRCDTTNLDAYLNPVLRSYLEEIRFHLPGSQIQVMTSSGGLVDSRLFRGRDCILSGPAGGIVGFSKVAQSEGFDRSIGFDMGGTSTDVARFDGEFEFENETTKAGVRILTPVLAIETVAAGGGSICGFDGARLFVGPHSAGAHPGPACYGSGGPLTVTDLNVFLGRILSDHFPVPLDHEAVQTQLESLRQSMASSGAATLETPLHQLAEGLLQIANDNMVQAIRRVSVAKGYHPADYILVSFGGAGGQHSCSIARSLGIDTVLIHPLAGILSAYGMGRADVRAIRQQSLLLPLDSGGLAKISQIRDTMEMETRDEVILQGVSPDLVSSPKLSLELRYEGTDSALMIEEPQDGSFTAAFETEHRRLFGYIRLGRQIEVASIRVVTTGSACESDDIDMIASGALVASEDVKGVDSTTRVWFEGKFQTASVVPRDQIHIGQRIEGPAIVCEPTSTVFIEPGSHATITDSGAILILVSAEFPSRQDSKSQSTVDPVSLEVFNNQFVSIAEQMGETLRRTAISTNVRERLDYSCAIFDINGDLVVNAPHVPVHLGAMGETVRAIVADHPNMLQGDVFVTNDPYRGGSHLPDVTVVTPVFCEDKPVFYLANRAHHAEIGGSVPGSMPPFSSNLAEEGILIRSQKLVAAGESREEEIRNLLSSGLFPSRAVDDNLADLAAQAAANECGAQLLLGLANIHSTETILEYMKHIQTTAASKMRLCLRKMERNSYEFEDQLDDGARICVKVSINGDEADVDFTGTSTVHPGNLNANRAITTAAVLYCFRCLLNESVPLNSGVLQPLRILLPESMLNPEPGATPDESPAIVGGNVETSQRIVDVLLGALGLAAASQGTMNNLTFGDSSFGYYETICGGSGATPTADGADAVHTHMTNTRLTDPEVLEQRFPARLKRFSVRTGSGGTGRYCGGNGILREIEFLNPLRVSMLSQRRGSNVPFGLEGGQSGKPGRNLIIEGGVPRDLDSCFSVEVDRGTILVIETPGGGAVGMNV